MGMDLLEITCSIEETFDIAVSEEDLTNLVRDRDITVGDLYEWLLKKLHLRDVGRYDIRLNYKLWREVQHVLHCVTCVPLDRIELSTPLEILFPKENRRFLWASLGEAGPYRVRSLEYPKAVRVIGFWLAAAMVVIEQFQLWQLPIANWLWPVLGILGLWMVGETYLKLLSICEPLRKSFPSGMVTVKDLCRSILGANYEEICNDMEVAYDPRCLAVWQKLVEILVDVLGIEPDAITFRSRLIRDLGME